MVKTLNALTSIKENVKACCTYKGRYQKKGREGKRRRKSALSLKSIYDHLLQPKAAFCPMCPFQLGSEGQEFAPKYLTYKLWMSHFLTINTDWPAEVSFSYGRLVRHGPFVGPPYRTKFHTLICTLFFIDKNVKYGGLGNGVEHVSFSLAIQLQVGEQRIILPHSTCLLTSVKNLNKVILGTFCYHS